MERERQVSYSGYMERERQVSYSWYMERKSQVSYSWHLSWSTDSFSPDNPQLSWPVQANRLLFLKRVSGCPSAEKRQCLHGCGVRLGLILLIYKVQHYSLSIRIHVGNNHWH
ncbi:uncharacterized protein [Mytilus edulis]|uniref:uncharacterized protein n=1 Tax=Mytilus edulis TaxID=6550 RepID=UPI0039EEC5F4